MTGGGDERPRVPDSARVAPYAALREQYRPALVRLLLIGESPPDPRDGEKRFFYSPKLTGADDLYRAVAEALYGEDEIAAGGASKERVLRRFKDDGLYLVDAVDEPINARAEPERSSAVRAALPQLVDQCRLLHPALGVVVCKDAVYRLVADPLRRAGIHIAHDSPLPFPVRYRPDRRSAFIEGVRTAWHGQTVARRT